MFCDNDLNPQPELGDLQGNILVAYKRLKSRNLLIRFKGPLAEAKTWLRTHVAAPGARFAPTTAQQQEQEGASSAASMLKSFMLTAEGLRYLGATTAGMCPAFQRGARHEATIRKLNDPTPDAWPDEYRSPWHAMLLLAGNDDGALDALAQEVKSSELEAEFRVEVGNAIGSDGLPLSEPSGFRHEHFGYRDGLSQPVYLESHLERLPTYHRGVGQADPRRAPSTVLTRDPLSGASAGYATYFVYRKLEQDVTGFKERVEQYIGTLQRRGEFLSEVWDEKGGNTGYGLFAAGRPAPTQDELRDYVTQRLMGRAKNGRPWPQWDGSSDPELNNFNFDADPGGGVCPFYAHVRKMNPRGATGNSAAEKRKTLTRRSIPYGTRDTREGRYKQDVGLLFMCAQASIEDQFEFVQQQWANAESVDLEAAPTPTVDTLIGQRPQNREQAEYAVDRHRKIGETIEVDLDFYDLVKLRGAEYFIVPSISGLKNLASEVG
jgi:Dyp-type peroxidase family